MHKNPNVEKAIKLISDAINGQYYRGLCWVARYDLASLITNKKLLYERKKFVKLWKIYLT